MPNSPNTQSEAGLRRLMVAVSNMDRWRILSELFHGDPMPLTEIARRIGVSVTNTSKHLEVLVRAKLLERAYGKLYRLPRRFVVEGERSLDFGRVRIRLDAK